jgi:NAD(P)-dependent dehydrogenase (short-subunit alcohol dehydrogenase family)
MRFSNKFVIVTGAAGGIGSAVVSRFLSEGAKVCAVDNRKEALDLYSSRSRCARCAAGDRGRC